MDIYMLNAKCVFGQYMEVVERMPDMEEKGKCYVGFNRRIDKKKIGVIEEGNYQGSFILYLANPEEILEGRKQLHEKVVQYTAKKYEEALKNRDAAEKFVLGDLNIRDY